MVLDDWIGGAPGIVAVANVVNTERLQGAENLREVGVVSRICVAQVCDCAGSIDERSSGRGLLGRQVARLPGLPRSGIGPSWRIRRQLVSRGKWLGSY